MVISNTPIFLRLGTRKKKNYYLNLNGYRNWAFHLSNTLKKEYVNIVKPLLDNLPKLGVVEIEYTIYYPTQRAFDIDNIGAVVGKFFQDTLVSCKKIEDDNYKFIPKVTYKFGGVDKQNPRVDINITEI